MHALELCAGFKSLVGGIDRGNGWISDMGSHRSEVK